MAPENPDARLPTLREAERDLIARTLERCRGNQRRAARSLGISRWSLSRRMRKYGFAPADGRLADA